MRDFPILTNTYELQEANTNFFSTKTNFFNGKKKNMQEKYWKKLKLNKRMKKYTQQDGNNHV